MSYPTRKIGFAPDLVILIQNGVKVVTYRLGDKYDFLKKGDIISAVDDSSGDTFGAIEILEKSYTTFGKLPVDRKGHEVYSSKQIQRHVFEGYYKRKISDSDRCIVLEFRLIKK